MSEFWEFKFPRILSFVFVESSLLIQAWQRSLSHHFIWSKMYSDQYVCPANTTENDLSTSPFHVLSSEWSFAPTLLDVFRRILNIRDLLRISSEGTDRLLIIFSLHSVSSTHFSLQKCAIFIEISHDKFSLHTRFFLNRFGDNLET